MPDDRAKAIVDDLRSLAIQGLGRMYVPEEHRFAHALRWDGGADRLSGLSDRYTAIVLIGLASQDPGVCAEILGDETAVNVGEHLLEALPGMQNIGDVALTLWAAGALGHPDAGRALERLRQLDPLAAHHSTVEIAWTLTSLTSHHELVSDRRIAERVARRLMESFHPRSELFPHWPNDTAARNWRRHVTCFADWVYPIQALAHYHQAVGEQEALDIANRSAARMCSLQGEAGQWWWHFDVRTGAVIERYPVYAVHQDAMAPMALFALRDAGGVDHCEAVHRGLAWLVLSPERNDSLIDHTAGLIWRKVGRREPGKLTRALQALAARAHPSLRVPLTTPLFPPCVVDQECRPYHLGWVLYAFSRAQVETCSSVGAGT